MTKAFDPSGGSATVYDNHADKLTGLQPSDIIIPILHCVPVCPLLTPS